MFTAESDAEGAERGPSSRQKVYGDLLALIAVADGQSVVASLLMTASLWGIDLPAWTGELRHIAGTLCVLGGGYWLVTLIVARSRGHLRASGTVLQLLTACVLTAVAIADILEYLGASAGWMLPHLAVTVWLSAELLSSRGVLASLRLPLPRGILRVRGAVCMGCQCIVTAALLVLNGFLMAIFQIYIPGPRETDQKSALGLDDPAVALAHYAWTAVNEEVVLCAALILLLRAAGRPTWEWVLIPLLPRVTTHLYLGASGLAVVVLGLGAVWLLTRRTTLISLYALIPLAAGHFLYDWKADSALNILAPTTPAYAQVTLAGLIAAAAALGAQALYRPERHPTRLPARR